MQRLIFIINKRTLLVGTLAIVSTWLCDTYDIRANFSVTFLLTAVIFPVVFSIHSAYERREKALKEYAVLKANGRSMYLALRDWPDKSRDKSLATLRGLLQEFMENFVRLITDDHANLEVNQNRVYESFSRISNFIKTDMRQQGIPPTELSRISNFLNDMLLAFESIKHIYQYRTPRTLKIFGDFFVTLVPLIYGPYFAYMGLGYSPGLQFIMPVMFSIVLTALTNIQGQLENPFDQFGEDDVVINTDRFIDSLQKV